MAQAQHAEKEVMKVHCKYEVVHQYPDKNEKENDDKNEIREVRKVRRAYVCTKMSVFNIAIIVALISMSCTATWLLTSRHYSKLASAKDTPKAMLLTAKESSIKGDGTHEQTGADDIHTADNSNEINPFEQQEIIWDSVRLPHSLIPRHYTLVLKIDVDNLHISGAVTIDLDCTENTNFIVIHANNIQIDESLVNVSHFQNQQNRVQIDYQFQIPKHSFYVIVLQEELQEGNKYILSIQSFTSFFQSGTFGTYLSKYRTLNNTVTMSAGTQFESVFARMAFPCFDEPHLKATFDISIIHSPNYIAVSNMDKITSETGKDGWVTDSFSRTPIMSTYLIAFSVNDFLHETTTTRNNMTIRIWAPKEQIALTSYATQIIPHIYHYFEEFLDVKEIIPSVEHIAIDSMWFVAMENWGLITYQPGALLISDDISTYDHKRYATSIITHEIAHTWFGNMVTMDWWTNLWLNEAFATLTMYMCIDYNNPEWKIWEKHLVGRVWGDNWNSAAVQHEDAFPSSHPIYLDFETSGEVMQYFDGIPYVKGSHVLRMLRGLVGEKNFQEGLQRYIKQYQFSNANMSNLWDIMSEASGRLYDTEMIMDTWIKQKGYPVVNVVAKDNTIVLTQEHFLLDPSNVDNQMQIENKWEIPFTYKTSVCKNCNLSDEVIVVKRLNWIHKNDAETTITIDTDEKFWIVGNVDSNGYYLVNYWHDNWMRLIEMMNSDHSQIETETRMALLNSAFMLAKATKLDYSIPIQLSLHLRNDHSVGPWQMFLFHMNYMATMLAESSYSEDVNEFMLYMMSPNLLDLGWVEEEDNRQRKELRVTLLNAAFDYGNQNVRQKASRLFTHLKKGNYVPQNFRPLIYRAGVKIGGAHSWEYMLQYSQRTRVPGDKIAAYNSLAAVHEIWLLQEYLQSLVEGAFQNFALHNGIVAFEDSALSRTVASCFLEAHWEQIYQWYKDDSLSLDTLLHARVMTVNTDEEYEHMIKLFESQPLTETAKLSFAKAKNFARLNVHWMKTHSANVGEILTKVIHNG